MKQQSQPAVNFKTLKECNRFLGFLHRSLQGHGNSFLGFVWNDIYRLLKKDKTINKYEDDLLQRFVTRTQTKRLHLPKKVIFFSGIKHPLT